MAENVVTEKAVTYKDVLRYIYDSEECKVDSVEAKRLKRTAEQLCLNVNCDFLGMFNTVEKDINKIKLKKHKSLSQAMYQYSAGIFMDHYRKLESTTEHKNIVLWQVCI